VASGCQTDGLACRVHEAGRLFDAAPAEVQDGVLRILRATSRRRR
jgi:hypothetical protein